MLVGEKHTWLKPGSQEALFLVSAVLHDPEEITHLPVSVTCGGGTDGPRASLILTFCDSRWKVRGLGDQLYVGGGGGQNLRERGCGEQSQQSGIRDLGPQHLRARRKGRGSVVGMEFGWGCLEGSAGVASPGGWVRCGGAYHRGIASG